MEWKDEPDGPGKYACREADNPNSHPCGDFILWLKDDIEMDVVKRRWTHLRWFKLPPDPDAPHGGKEARGCGGYQAPKVTDE